MRFTVISLLSLLHFVVFGQQEERISDQSDFDAALDVYYDEEYDSALALFQSFVVKNPRSPLVSRAKYNIGYIFRELDRDEESIPVFEELLQSDYDEKERFGGLMEQYALYKHRSASHLAEIYLDKGDYEKAAKYIRLFDKKYKYKHFGGNERMANEIYTAISYARLYDGQGNSEKAIKQLLPYLFDDGLASNSHLLDILNGILVKEYDDTELKMLVESAKSSLVVKDDDKAFIDFLGTRIKVSDYQLFDLSNPEMQENLELAGVTKWRKVLDTHPIFKRYLH